MRLHLLTLIGIGPFRRQQSIDFDRLSASGLFLIDGPTGAGKTMLIDAIAYALYGTVSGSDSDSDKSRIRSDHSGVDEPSEIVLEFSVNGRRHRIVRTPEYMRPKRNDPENFTKQNSSQVAQEFGSEGIIVWESASAHEIGSHVRELLGMSSEQFRQLVVLPQGEFAELLRMKPIDRLKALAPLLGNAFFEKVQMNLQDRATDARSKRMESDAAVLTATNKLSVPLEVLTNNDENPRAGELLSLLFNTSGQDEERSASLAEILELLTAMVTQANTQKSNHEAATSVAEQEAGLAARLAAEIGAIVQARKRMEQTALLLEDADSGLDAPSASARLVELQQAIGRCEPDARWEDEASTRSIARQGLLSARDSDQSAQDLLVEQGQDIPRRRSELEKELREAAISLDQALNLGVKLLGLTDQLSKATSLGLVGVLRESAQGELNKSEAKAAQAASALEETRSRLDSLYLLQSAQRAERLAAQLVNGQPCPVCGSPVHPSPADLDASSELLTDEELAIARSGVDTHEMNARAALAEVQLARQKVIDLDVEQAGLIGAVGDREVTDLVEEVTRCQAEVASTNAVRETVSMKEREQNLLIEREADIAVHLEASRVLVEGSRKALADHDRDAQLKSQQIAAHLGDAPSATAMLSNLRERVRNLTEYHEAMATHGKLLASIAPGTLEVDFDVAQQQAASTKERLDKENELLALANSRVITISGARDQAISLGADLLAAFKARKTLVGQTHTLISTADLVVAKSGSANTRKLALASYAVQQRFMSVLQAASVHLDRMSSGKYELVLEEEAKGNQQAGLGISILDTWTGKRRDPRTLSGGETFYASLSLALGLADVVRDESGGAQLDTLFVDEGFGSLDQETLQVVLEQLDRLRSGGRIVGVVSHVTEMKEWVHERVEVCVEDDRTSRVRVF